MCKDLNLFCRRSISSPATVTVFVKEYFRCFVLLSFYSKKFSLCIFIALIALTIALNPPIILDGVRLKLHSVAKSIMPLRMGSRVRIPHRTAAVLAERLSRPFGSVTGAKALGRRECLLRSLSQNTYFLRQSRVFPVSEELFFCTQISRSV